MQLSKRITGWFRTLTPRQRAWFPYIVLAAAVFAAYANVYQNDFVWDDMFVVVYNETLRHWSHFPDLLLKTTFGPSYRPIQGILYFLIYQGFGLSQAAFHAANVLVQVANTCLIYRLGCRLGFFRRASFAAALLWGVHPLWVEAVAVVAGIADMLVVLFFLLGLLALLPDFKPRKLGLSALFFLFALCCKESAAVFPALVTSMLFLVSKERLRPATYLRTWPLWLLGIAYLIGWSLCPVLNDNFAGYLLKSAAYVDTYDHNFINRVLTSLATLPVYLGMMLTPARLHMAWDFPVFTTIGDWHVVAGAAIVALALLQIAWGRGKRGVPLTWGLLWFAAAISPYTGILKPIDGRLSEHWIYLATVALFLGTAQMTVAWMDTRRSKKAPVIAAGLVVLAALALGTQTYIQNKTLRNTGTLFESIIKDNPTVWAYYQLGVYYFGKKDFAKAEEAWRAVEADDAYTQFLNKGGQTFMHSSLAFIYLNALSPTSDNISVQDVARALPSSTHLPEAIEELNMLQHYDPENGYANSFLSLIYYYQGDKAKGDYYRDAAEKNAPKN